MTNMINIGCGQTPTKGWKNYDNSWSIRLKNRPFIVALLRKIGVLSNQQMNFISFAKKENIFWADAIKLIPEENSSVDVVYSSHMIEHLEKQEVELFFAEALRALKPNATIRIAVPDIKYHVEKYLEDGNADKFIQDTLLAVKRPKTVLQKIKYFIIGDRHHLWMYDGNSLCKLLSSSGFLNPQIMEAGTTQIANSSGLDLHERSPESVFVEAFKP